MKPLKRLSLFVLLFSFCCHAKSNNISFQTIGFEKGLSQVTVYSTAKDRLNRVWIGTNYGLNCWDGVEMKTYYAIKGDTNSLLEHMVTQIIPDDDRLWLRCKSGICELNLNTLKFRRFYFNEPVNLTLFQNQVLICAKKGIYTLNKKNKKISLLLNTPVDYIQRFYNDNNDSLYVGSFGGKVGSFNPGKKNIQWYKFNFNSPVTALFMDKYEVLWVGSQNNGVVTLSKEKKLSSRINITSDGYKLPSNVVRKITADSYHRIWIGTFRGISLIDPGSSKYHIYQQTDNNPNSLSNNSVYDIHIDQDNFVWIGTYFGGVSYCNLNQKSFVNYSKEIFPSRKLKVIGKMVEDKNENIWIATEVGGIYYFNRTNRDFINYKKAENAEGPSQTNIRHLYLAPENKLYIGTYLGGLNILDLTTLQFKHVSVPESEKNRPSDINKIIPYLKKYVVATDIGVYFYNPLSEKYTDVFIDKEVKDSVGGEINTICLDSFNNLWIGTRKNGAFLYNFFTGQFKHYRYNELDSTSIGYNSINQILEDTYQRIWISTIGGGLSLYDRETDNFVTITKKKDGLPSDIICGVVQSHFGNLWVATSKGLVRYDNENNKLYNYDAKSGFPLQELNLNSILLTGDGELFVGGIDGLISFYEEDLIQSKQQFELIISTLKVNNHVVSVNDKTNILDQEIALTKDITLKAKHSSFNLSYTACNYYNMPRNKYQYMLEDLDSDWINADYSTSVNYTGLPAGKYVFKVRATNTIYSPISDEKHLKITIVPPFYKSWYAYFIYITITVAIIILFNYYIISKTHIEAQLKAERKDKERINEFNEQKLSFFTNISHEYKTPLTLIIGSLEPLIESNKVHHILQEKLKFAYKGAKQLKKLTNELLDFRRINKKKLIPHVEENEIVEFVSDIFDFFSGIAEKRGIEYSFQNPNSKIQVWFDADQIEKALYNLLSNAFKHVQDTIGKISVQINNLQDEIVINVIDNGQGIEESQRELIFNRFYQSDNVKKLDKYAGSGIGLALCKAIVEAHKGEISYQSKIGAGSTFSILLLKGEGHIDNEYIIKNEDVKRDYLHEEILDELQNQEREWKKNIPDENAPLLLIVEDDEDLIKLIEDLFSDTYRFLKAKDGEKGLEFAINNSPDIIISDVMMPKLTGMELCNRLKQNINTSHIPVILLTALSSDIDKIKGLETGADDYITKPFSPKVLKARIDNLLTSIQLRQVDYIHQPDIEFKTISNSAIDQNFIEKVQNCILENLNNPQFSVDSLADELGLGRTVFFKKIKSITGITPNEIIQTIRLKKAAKLLIENTGFNITEIAYEVGFSSQRYFTQCFKNHFGVIPSKYGQEEA